MKKVYRQKVTPTQSPKKAPVRTARAVTSRRKQTVSVPNGSLAGDSSVANRPFELNWQLSDQEREQIRKDIIEGAKEMNDLYLEETKAWYPLEEEVRLKFEAGLYDDTFVPEKLSG
jgi:hypothetical protein